VTRPALPFLALYLALALGLFLLMRDHAFHPTDDGFILAYSWRIANGQVPYRDFIFERPPLTPYLHVVWLALPDGWQIQAGRLAFYLEMAAAAVFPTLWAVSRGLRANVVTLALAAGTFLISLHNFPPMPWPTVDAVFFASAGVASCLAWLDGRSPRWLASSVVLLTLSTLAKQNFAPLLLVVAGYGIFVGLRRREFRLAAAAIVPPAVIGAAFVLALVAAGALGPFLRQISEPMQMRPTAGNPWSGDFFAVGVQPYLIALTPGRIPLLAFVNVVFFARPRSARAALFAVPLVMALVVLAALDMPIGAYVYNSGFVIFFGTLMVALAEALHAAQRRPTAAPLPAYGLLLLAGWCASLSFAYQSPILAIGMVAPVVALAIGRRPTRFEGAVAAAAALVVVCISVLINVNVPYRDAPREEQTANLAEIYPRFGDLYTSEINAERHRELRDLAQRFALDRGRDFVVFTAFPLAHFLTGTMNPLSVDWLEPQEYFGNEDRLRRELEVSRPVMIVQRQQGETWGIGAPAWSCAQASAHAPAFAADMLAGASLVSETPHFCVYAP
jgi:hypothetical protein